jgi:hypothetical protein
VSRRGRKTGPTPKRPPNGMSRARANERQRLTAEFIRKGAGGSLDELVARVAADRETEQAFLDRLHRETGAVDLSR